MDALSHAGCERIFTDQISGSKNMKPGLDELKYLLRKGDHVFVWKLDRLGRSLRDLVDLINFFESKEVGFNSI